MLATLSHDCDIKHTCTHTINIRNTVNIMYLLYPEAVHMMWSLHPEENNSLHNGWKAEEKKKETLNNA